MLTITTIGYGESVVETFIAKISISLISFLGSVFISILIFGSTKEI